jgi:hypothetical protein
MEDHLRNKFRLDQEWQTLCAYEAETSAGFLVASKVRVIFMFLVNWTDLDNTCTDEKISLAYSSKIMKKTDTVMCYPTITPVWC